MRRFLGTALPAGAVASLMAMPRRTCSSAEQSPASAFAEWDWNWDGAAPSGPLAKLSAFNRGPTRHLILVRHGQYELTAKTQHDDALQKLTALGREQARMTGAWLAQLRAHGGGGGGGGGSGSGGSVLDASDAGSGSGVPVSTTNSTGVPRLHFKCVVSSTMTRARETADIIRDMLGSAGDGSSPASPLAAMQDDDLREGVPCAASPGGRAVVASTSDRARMERAFTRHFNRARVRARVERPAQGEGSASIANEPEPEHVAEVIVCHGNVIRYLCCLALQIPAQAWMRLQLSHCSVVWIEIRPNGAVVLNAFGSSTHMPIDNITF